MNRANLILHCGANKVDREELSLVPLPQQTASYMPVGHHTLLDGVEKSLASAGLSIVSQAHGLSKDGARYFGLLQVANGDNPDDFGLVVGIRNSHDKSFPAGLVLGASVFVCDNLSFSSEVRLDRKHTVFVHRDLPQVIERAVGRLGDLRHTQEKRFAAYKGKEIGDSQAHDLIIRALDARVLPVTTIPKLIKEWREPRHPEFKGRTVWSLQNCFSEILKGGLYELPRRTQALHGLLDAACGLTLAV